MNNVKKYPTIHFQLNQIDVLEVLILSINKDLSNKISVPNKTKDLNIHDFHMITGKNQSTILTKHISCECKCKFDRRKCN